MRCGLRLRKSKRWTTEGVSGELHLSAAIRKIRIPSEQWEDDGVLMYNLDVAV